MSVAELEAQIDTLSVDIVRQKELLKTLERSKSATQRRLNAIRDPVARFPFEVSSAIFVNCLASHPSLGKGNFPMMFLAICNAWTDIALSTPALWDSFHADRPLVDMESLLDAWIKRAGTCKLSISLPHSLPDKIPAILGRHAHRWHGLKLYHDDNTISSLVAVGPFPSLKTLQLVGVEIKNYPSSISATRDMLLACPNLVECTLDDVWYRPSTSNPAEPLVIPSLQLLHFKGPRVVGRRVTCDEILKHVFLPCLQSLAVSIEPTHLLHFLRNSSPPLRKLTLAYEGYPPWSLQEMEECFSFVPMLEDFLFNQPYGQSTHHFLHVLTNSPHLLPNLVTITYQSFDPYGQEWYQELVSALYARREQIHLVRIIWISTGNRARPEAPSEELCVHLRQLVAEGMEIHIGPAGQNHI